MPSRHSDTTRILPRRRMPLLLLNIQAHHRCKGKLCLRASQNRHLARRLTIYPEGSALKEIKGRMFPGHPHLRRQHRNQCQLRRLKSEPGRN